jgi:hypothetical protein
MKSSTLILIAGVIALALFACNQPATPLPQPGGPAPQASPVCDAQGGLRPVPFVMLPFDPTQNQTPTTSTMVDNDVQTDLNAAFSMAAGFQTALCGLDGIFIDPTGCSTHDPHSCALTPAQIADNSWGLRTYPQNSLPGKRYIGLSLGLWNNTNSRNPWPCPSTQTACAPPFSTYQTGVIRTVLQRLSPNAVYDSSPPDFDNVYPDTAAFAVLAALSHEFGHVLWWQTFVTNPGDPHTSNTTTFCNGLFYPDNLWSVPVDVPPNRWIGFGKPRDIPSGAEILSVQDGLNRGSSGNQQGFRDAGDHLDLLLSNKRWASILAAFSPDEEFVEVFQLHILLNANPKLQHLEIRIFGNNANPYKHDRPFNLNPHSVLGQELQCF